jgi:hypothetical protein
MWTSTAARERAGWITPVPGGVGPMTIASLLENTLQAAELHAGCVPRGTTTPKCLSGRALAAVALGTQRVSEGWPPNEYQLRTLRPSPHGQLLYLGLHPSHGLSVPMPPPAISQDLTCWNAMSSFEWPRRVPPIESILPVPPESPEGFHSRTCWLVCLDRV